MSEEYKPNSEVVKAHKLLTNAKKSADTKYHDMLQAYSEASKKHLTKDNKIDYSLLKEKEVRESMTKDMIKHLKSTYQKQTGIDLSNLKEEGLEDELLEMNYGINETNLKQMFDNYKEEFTAKTYLNDVVGQNIQQLHQSKIQHAINGINRTHLDDILKYTKLNKEPIVKEKISDRALSQILIQYANKNKISSEWLEEQPFYKRKDDEKKE